MFCKHYHPQYVEKRLQKMFDLEWKRGEWFSLPEDAISFISEYPTDGKFYNLYEESQEAVIHRMKTTPTNTRTLKK